MEASQVTIGTQTWDSNKLTYQRKRKLREEAIKDLIRSKPYGTVLGQRHFNSVLHMKEDTQAITWVTNNLTRTGKLERHNVGKRRYFYTIPGEVKVTTPAIVMREKLETKKTIAPEPQWSASSIEEALTSLANKGMKFTLTITNTKAE
jgi:hypothetical protein